LLVTTQCKAHIRVPKQIFKVIWQNGLTDRELLWQKAASTLLISVPSNLDLAPCLMRHFLGQTSLPFSSSVFAQCTGNLPANTDHSTSRIAMKHTNCVLETFKASNDLQREIYLRTGIYSVFIRLCALCLEILSLRCVAKTSTCMETSVTAKESSQATRYFRPYSTSASAPPCTQFY